MLGKHTSARCQLKLPQHPEGLCFGAVYPPDKHHKKEMWKVAMCSARIITGTSEGYFQRQKVGTCPSLHAFIPFLKCLSDSGSQSAGAYSYWARGEVNSLSDIVLMLFLDQHNNVCPGLTLHLINHIVMMPLMCDLEKHLLLSTQEKIQKREW